MRKFLRACHIISRIFIFLIMAAILLLYFIRPDTLGFLNTGAAADGIFWEVFATTFSMAAVMFAASDWAYRSMEDNDYLVTLSSSILRPCYEEHDLSDKRYTKAAAADGSCQSKRCKMFHAANCTKFAAHGQRCKF